MADLGLFSVLQKISTSPYGIGIPLRRHTVDLHASAAPTTIPLLRRKHIMPVAMSGHPEQAHVRRVAYAAAASQSCNDPVYVKNLHHKPCTDSTCRARYEPTARPHEQ
jgi:hypothetical protein